MKSRILAALAVLLLSVPAAALAADYRELTLPEAVKLALANNRTVTLARLKVQEIEQKKAGAKADLFSKTQE
jgi:outer membrane protein TolC